MSPDCTSPSSFINQKVALTGYHLPHSIRSFSTLSLLQAVNKLPDGKAFSGLLSKLSHLRPLFPHGQSTADNQ